MSVIFLLFAYSFLLINNVYSFKLFSKKDKNLSPDSDKDNKNKNVNERLKGQFPRLKESGDDLINTIMSKYLSNNTPSTREICRYNSNECLELIKMYSERCVKGDCYTLDHITLIEFPNGFNILAPSITQFLFARDIFNISRAREKAPFYNFYRNLYWEIKGNPRSLESFNKNLIRHNLARLELGFDPRLNSKIRKPNSNRNNSRDIHEHESNDGNNDNDQSDDQADQENNNQVNNRHHSNDGPNMENVYEAKVSVAPNYDENNSGNSSENDSELNDNSQISNPENDRIVLTESLYNFTLNYLTFIFKHPLLSSRCRFKFFRLLFRWIQRRHLIRIVRNVAKVKVLSVGMRDLKAIINCYSLYLNTGVTHDHYRLNFSYSKLVKHAIIKLMGENRVGYLMSDCLLRFPVQPKSYCSDNAPANCYDSLMDYLDRCEDGDCVILNSRMLLDGKDPLNVALPRLSQLDVAFYLFSKSRAYKNVFLDFILRRSGRLSSSEFADLLLKKNTKNVKYSSKDHEIIYKYLYFDTIQYKIWTLKSKFSKLFSKNVHKIINEYLTSLVHSHPINLERNVLEALFVAYRNYLFQSKLSEKKDNVIEFVQKCYDLLVTFKDTMKVIKLSKKNEKKEKHKQDEPSKDLYEPVISFNWEKEDLKKYEEGEWTKVGPSTNPPHLRAIEVKA